MSIEQVIFSNLVTNEEYGRKVIPFLKEEMMITIEFFEEKAINLILQPQVILEVIDTQAYIKGQTSTSSYKPALLENNIKTTIPPHIVVGDKIVVSTIDASYVEKAK